MGTVLAELGFCLRLRIAVWRDRHLVTAVSLADALDEALHRFLDHPIHQEARALAELAGRRSLGQAPFDA